MAQRTRLTVTPMAAFACGTQKILLRSGGSFHDGLLVLLNYIQAHLFREAWWREKGEWLGPEAPHGPPKEHVTEGEEERALDRHDPRRS